MSYIKNILLICIAAGAAISSAAQVEGERSRQDTLYIYEEEITYDTLYVRDSLNDYAEMSKNELIEVFLRDRGIGQLYYQKGAMYLTGADELYRLDRTDLKWMLSAPVYEEYRKAKRNQYISIPLYVASGAAAATAALGLYQFCASFVQTAKYNEQILNNVNNGLVLWRSAMGGFFLFGGGIIATTAFMVPALVLTINSKVRINRIVENFNASPTTAMQVRFCPTPAGAGLAVLF